MTPADREEFGNQLAQLFGAFPQVTLTDNRMKAYWRGLQKMSMPQLERVIDHTLAGNELMLPSVSRLWMIHRELTVRPVSAAPPRPKTREEQVQTFVESCAGQALLLYLQTGGRKQIINSSRLGAGMQGASAEAFEKILKAKARLVKDFIQIGLEDPGLSGKQIRTALWKAWDQVFAPRTAEEEGADLEHYQRTGAARADLDPFWREQLRHHA